MAVDTGTLGHQFNINDVSLRLVPEARSTFNEFDSFGALLGLDRLAAENNADYKKRLLDVYVHRANSTYSGLINGITRELGLELFVPVTFTLETSLPGGAQPAIAFKDNRFIVYLDHVAGTVEMDLDRSNPEGDIYTVQQLVTYINAESDLYTATLTSGTPDFTLTDCITSSTSVQQITAETVPLSPVFTLKNANVLEGTLVFSDFTNFIEEVGSQAAVNGPGKYYVDYTTGFVASYGIATQGSVVRYKHSVSPFAPVASPVIIRNLQSDEFKSKMFEQIVHPDGTTSHGIPTEFGAEIINELMSVVPVYWGV